VLNISYVMESPAGALRLRCNGNEDLNGYIVSHRNLSLRSAALVLTSRPLLLEIRKA
jgi:hypothetical protein